MGLSPDIVCRKAKLEHISGGVFEKLKFGFLINRVPFNIIKKVP